MYDVIVIGGGHAGVEAAAASARCGAKTALVTQLPDRIGAMSCNPSIGGVGKGHIVREIDALDGIMARAADQAAIHHRMLNTSKGAAVHGPRVQADRGLYSAAVKRLLAEEPGISIIKGEAGELLIQGAAVTGIRLTTGVAIHAPGIILASGTFLGGKLFRGDERTDGGRLDERPALRLAAQLRDCGLRVARLKTGTPPRLDGRTINWACLAEQPSDRMDWTMSSFTGGRLLPQLACAITRTTAATHDIIRSALHRSPMYVGAIEGRGPRYCPSIEDKIARFGDRDGHQIFLEPEGLGDATVYPNGISTSLPCDVQLAMVRTVAGLERAEITTPGYAVEYDYLDPRDLNADLQSRTFSGLFCAGQINGTTGYEEAAGQGLIAGVNAAAHALGRAPLVLDRASSYVGVMIDDLVLQGVTEPYRMLTARAEYRLSLRADNAEQRLTTIGAAAGCLSDRRKRHADLRERQREQVRRTMEQVPAVTEGEEQDAVAGGAYSSWAEKLVSGRVDDDQLFSAIGGPRDIVAEVAMDLRYRPYLQRQATEIARLREQEAMPLPDNIVFGNVPGLSAEMVERLEVSRPRSLAAAARIGGVTPAALAAILLHVRRHAA